ERPETPEPDWTVPPNDLPKTENNWANAIDNAYKDPEENKLIHKINDMGSFIKWYCKQIGKLKLSKSDLEGKANMESQSESMVTVPIRQASSSAPPLSTPIIDLTTPKLVSPPA
nr:hypothetical protein [Tanacetum cinerariifolium]